ncbi:major facilitator superfamily domain-containing protein [Naematelia encephala]|uniref:Major facilitator superfamily domain-containing protein n=1 Tax=Naematelia encephala TaxID=71784 RepID=A0A1Y2AQS6_9TREE|nr:major facilitator superfamily domain-containing protein [Naematelia encephala]
MSTPTESQAEQGVSKKYPGKGTIQDPFVVDFDEDDSANPRGWSQPYKWMVNIIRQSAMCMMTGTFAVSSYSSGTMLITPRDLGKSAEVLAVGQTLFLNGIAFGSVIFPGTADYFGRKKVIVITMTVFTAFSAGVAAGRNLETVLVCRFFSGFAAAAGQSLIPAQVSSLWTGKDLAVPFTTAAIAPFLGPSLGPLLGGFVVQYSGSWRNIDWLAVCQLHEPLVRALDAEQMAIAGLFTLLYFALVPETFVPYILRKRAHTLEKQTGLRHVSINDKSGRKSVQAELKAHVIRPVRYLLFEPIVTIFTLYTELSVSFLYGVLNLFFEAFPYIYQIERKWSDPEGNAGLPFVALLVGFAFSVPVTIACGIPYSRAIARDGFANPELRLMFAMLSAILLPISLFWMGWTGTPSVSWGVPVVAGGVFGFAQIGLQMSAYFVRFNLSSVFPLFAVQMYSNLGVGWASSILGFILVAFLPAPFLFYRWGPKIRSICVACELQIVGQFEWYLAARRSTRYAPGRFRTETPEYVREMLSEMMNQQSGTTLGMPDYAPVAGGVGGGGPLSANLGNAIVRSLLAKNNVKVKILGRSESIRSKAAQQLAQLGAELVTVDYARDESVDAALTGVEVVISAISRAGADAQVALARASKRMNIQLFIPSEWGGDTRDKGADTPNGYKALMQTQLTELGVPFAIVQAGGFFEWIHLFLRDMATQKLIITGEGNTEIAFTSVHDIAGFTAHVLTALPATELPGRTFRIAGSTSTISKLIEAVHGNTGRSEVLHQTIKEALEAWRSKHDFLAWLRVEIELGRVKPNPGGQPLDNHLWDGWSGESAEKYAT